MNKGFKEERESPTHIRKDRDQWKSELLSSSLLFIHKKRRFHSLGWGSQERPQKKKVLSGDGAFFSNKKKNFTLLLLLPISVTFKKKETNQRVKGRMNLEYCLPISVDSRKGPIQLGCMIPVCLLLLFPRLRTFLPLQPYFCFNKRKNLSVLRTGTKKSQEKKKRIINSLTRMKE